MSKLANLNEAWDSRIRYGAVEVATHMLEDLRVEERGERLCDF
jgi:hypothetical protein